MADNLTTFCVSITSKSGSLNLLEPSEPVQACNGIALPLDHTSYSGSFGEHRLHQVCPTFLTATETEPQPTTARDGCAVYRSHCTGNIE